MATQTTERAFDELTRGLASGTLSRGKALRLMGAALVGGALASVPGTALADDDCRGFGRRCRRDRQCCSKNCVRRGDDKVCGCPKGKSRCGLRCINCRQTSATAAAAPTAALRGPSAWVVSARAANQYVIRPAQRERCARKVSRGQCHSATQHVIRPARKAVTVNAPVTVVVTSAPASSVDLFPV
jgi:hypothetical protein